MFSGGSRPPHVEKLGGPRPPWFPLLLLPWFCPYYSTYILTEQLLWVVFTRCAQTTSARACTSTRLLHIPWSISNCMRQVILLLNMLFTRITYFCLWYSVLAGCVTQLIILAAGNSLSVLVHSCFGLKAPSVWSLKQLKKRPFTSLSKAESFLSKALITSSVAKKGIEISLMSISWFICVTCIIERIEWKITINWLGYCGSQNNWARLVYMYTYKPCSSTGTCFW